MIMTGDIPDKIKLEHVKSFCQTSDLDASLSEKFLQQLKAIRTENNEDDQSRVAQI